MIKSCGIFKIKTENNIPKMIVKSFILTLDEKKKSNNFYIFKKLFILAVCRTETFMLIFFFPRNLVMHIRM